LTFFRGGGNWDTYKGWDDYQRFLSNPFHQMYVGCEVPSNTCEVGHSFLFFRQGISLIVFWMCDNELFHELLYLLATIVNQPPVTVGYTFMKPANFCDIVYGNYSKSWQRLC